MINDINFIKFTQNDKYFYMVSIKVNMILDNYMIDVYDNNTNPEGYQRTIQVSHRKKIVDYLEKSENPILNTAIIAAVNYRYIKEIEDKLEISGLMKIVDGQHRIEAFKELKLKNSELYFEKFENYEMPIIIIPEEKDKILEIETFININNKNKRVSTALAVQMLEKIREKRNANIYGEININTLSSSDLNELVDSTSNNVTKMLNNNKNGIWNELIRTGDSNTKGRIISFNAFSNSLSPVISNYLKYNDEILWETDELREKIFELICEAWDIVKGKWSDAFNTKYYNIQKGIGVYSIHNILSRCIVKNKDPLIEFSHIIEDSRVTSDDWIIGGKFAPLNSKSGIRMIEEYITNRISS